MKGSSELHSICVDEVLLMVSEFGVFWKNPIGVGKCLVTGNTVRYGLKGSPDIIGWLRDDWARFTGFEIKTGKAAQDPDQIAFQKVLQKSGGLYFLVRYNPPQYLHELRCLILRHVDDSSPLSH